MKVWIVVGSTRDDWDAHFVASTEQRANAWFAEHERFACEMWHDVIEREVDADVPPWEPDASGADAIGHRAEQDEWKASEKRRRQRREWETATQRFGSQWAHRARREFAEGLASAAAVEQFGDWPLRQVSP